MYSSFARLCILFLFCFGLSACLLFFCFVFCICIFFFCIILKSHFFICGFIDIDECKGNHSCHENANCTNTNGSHVCDCQPGYTGNGQNCTGEFGIARKCGHGWFILVRSFFFCIYNVFCAPVGKQEQFIAYVLDSVCHTKEKNWKIAAWIVGPTRESHETKKLQTSVPLFFIYMYMYDFWIKHRSHFSFFSLLSFLFFFFFWQILTNAKHTPTNVT